MPDLCCFFGNGLSACLYVFLLDQIKLFLQVHPFALNPVLKLPPCSQCSLFNRVLKLSHHRYPFLRLLITYYRHVLPNVWLTANSFAPRSHLSAHQAVKHLVTSFAVLPQLPSISYLMFTTVIYPVMFNVHKSVRIKVRFFISWTILTLQHQHAHHNVSAPASR